MPGVPSGRGCDACRKQKKKCDLVQPSCGRCTRLGISCIGCGEQRWKFKHQTAKSRASSTALQTTRNVKKEPARLLNCETAIVTGAFISLLEVPDIRYSLGCYGTFLVDIPRRLGTNEALDASVTAMTTAFSAVYTGESSSQALAKYTRALASLRNCLNDPKLAQKPETLCAIYLVMVCQTWIGRDDDQPTSHGEGITIILKTIDPQRWQSKFEMEMVITFCLAVLLESFVNPKIQLHPWFWKILDAYRGPDTSGCELRQKTVDEEENIMTCPIPSLKLRKLGHLPDYLRDPEQHLEEIQALYPQTLIDLPKLRLRVAKAAELPPSMSRIHSNSQVGLGMVLCQAQILNGILRAFDPWDNFLVEDSTKFSNEIVRLAEDAAQYRPLGASHIPLCLVVAWATAVDVSQRAEIEQILAEYQEDFPIARWLEGALWLESRLGDLCRKLWGPDMGNQASNSAMVTAKYGMSHKCCIQ